MAGEEPLLESLQHLTDVRYLTVVCYSILLYDVFLTFNAELEVVWRRRWSIVTLAYVINRYVPCIFVLFFLVGVLAPVNTLTTQWGIVIYQLIRLWDTKRSLSWLMASGFVFVHSITLVFVGVEIHEMHGKFSFAEVGNFKSCYVLQKPSALLGVYTPAVAFDLYAFTLLLVNALSRPRSASRPLLKLLYSDGAVFFFTTLSMRMLCLIFNIAAPPSLAVAGLIFPWAIVSVAVSRLYLRLQNRQSQSKNNSASGLEALLIANGTELNVRRYNS